MKRNKHHGATALLLLALPILASCRTELCYNHFATASVTLTWEREWERDYGMGHRDGWDGRHYGFDYRDLRPSVPEWVRLVRLYGGTKIGENFLRPGGADIVMNETQGHSFLLYNGDTEYIVFSDMASLQDARASATSRSRASASHILERHPDSRSTNPPDVLYSAFVEEIPEIGIHEVKEIPVKMQPLVYTYVVRYEFEYGQQHMVQARGALGGMAESVYLRDGRTSDASTIILYDCEIKDYGCEARVRSFGVPDFPDSYYGRSSDSESYKDKPYTLNLEVLLGNGKVLEFNFDVADQIKNQPRGGVIVVSGIRIEDEQNKSEMSDSGFDVDLSGWGEVDVDFPLDPY